MEEDNSREEISTIEIFQRNAGNKLANMYDIVFIILKNLEFCDLLKCRKVCSLWREVTEKIMELRIFIIEAKMEFSDLRKSILQPEKILPYLKLEDVKNVQCVSNCPTDIPYHHWLSATYNGLPVSSEWINKNVYDYFTDEKYDIFSNYNISVSCEIITRTAIFPSVPGIEIRRFSYTLEEIHECLNNGKLNIATKINVPENELKCVLWFFGDIIETLFLSVIVNPKCQFTTFTYAMGGIEKYSSIELSRGIAFCGKRIKAASLKLFSDVTDYTRLPIQAKFSKQQLQNLERYKINQKKCIGFLFFKYDCRVSIILSNFREYFPYVPIFANDCYWPTGTDYMPEIDDEETESNLISKETQDDKNPGRFPCASFVLVWFD